MTYHLKITRKDWAPAFAWGIPEKKGMLYALQLLLVLMHLGGNI